MKNNVDLTENQLFSRSNFFQDMALGVMTLAKLTGSKFPWNLGEFRQIKSDYEMYLDHQQNSFVPIYKIDSEKYCDCCGLRINKKPWHREFGLCSECDKRFKNEYNKPWEEKIAEIENRRISVFDFI